MKRKMAPVCALNILFAFALTAQQPGGPRTYVLGPDDQIATRAIEAEELSDKPVRIDAAGYIHLPMIGRLKAGGLTVEQLENDLIVPRAMSTATTVHPLAVLLAILAGGQLFGPIGALLAVPFATCVSVFLIALRGEQDEQSPAVRRAIGDLAGSPRPAIATRDPQ